MKKVGTSTYIQRVNTLERKLLKQVKELDNVMQIVKEIKKKTKKDRYKDEKLTKSGELVQIDTKHEYVNGKKFMPKM